MKNGKTPEGYLKKGIALIGTSESVITTPASQSPIPIFDTVFFNDSDNVTILSKTRVRLKKNIKYKIKFDLNILLIQDTTNDASQTKLFNVTDNTYFGVENYTISSEYAEPNGSLCLYGEGFGIISPTKDIDVEIRDIRGNIKQLYQQSRIVIEEVEAYLMTIPLPMETNITCTNATGTYIIPANLPIGYKFKVRKVNTTQGTVTISASGSEKITNALLSSVTLNSDGDFWLLEKVSATRWDLLDGRETGANSNGTYYRYSDGKQECLSNVSIVTISGQTIYSSNLWTFPKAFVNINYYSAFSQSGTHGDATYSTSTFGQDMIKYNYQLSFAMRMPGSPIAGIQVSASIITIGRWY